MNYEPGQILKSDKAKDQGKKRGQHSHLIYLSPNGTPVVSPHSSHTHLPLPSPEGALFLSPAEDGHTHQVIGECSPIEQKKKKDESELVREVHKLFRSAKEFESDFRKKGEESEGFYDGTGQWRKEDIDALESKGRSAVTINEIEPKIDLLRGYQAQNRYDYRFFPVEDGDSRVADILNVVVKNIVEQNNADHEETWAFEDQAVVGRGLLDTVMDFDKNVEGEIIIERFPWKDAYLGEHEKISLEDLEGLVKAKWFSLNKLKQYWPDKAEDIASCLDRFLADESREQEAIDGKKYDTGAELEFATDPDLVNVAKKEFRVLEAWRKIYRRVPVLVNASDDIYINADGWEKSDIQAAQTIGFKKVEQRVTEMQVTTVAGGQLLDDATNDDFDGDFSLVALYAKKRGKKIWGKVEAVKDAQREVNKRHSQYIDILNKSVAYGYWYDATTFANAQEEARFRKHSTSPGFTVKLQDINRRPVREEGAKYPAEVVQMISLSSTKIKEIMNINSEMLGQYAGANQTGIAKARQTAQGLMGNEFLFDNMALAKRMLGRKIVRLIQKYYTPQRILRILKRQANSQEQQVEVGGMPVDQLDEQAVLELLHTEDLTKYDVAVGKSAYSPTARLNNFMMWSDMATQGVNVPPEFLIELSDLPDKGKFMQMVQAANAQAAQSEQMKYSTEIQKAQIAAANKQGGMAPM